MEWNGMEQTSGYWCRHRSKDCSKAHPLPFQASASWLGGVIPMDNLPHDHIHTGECTQTGATLLLKKKKQKCKGDLEEFLTSTRQRPGIEETEMQRRSRRLPDICLIKTHTAPERCQPEKFATLTFSAFLVVCDQDKKLQIGQQILQGGNFSQLISLLLHHHLQSVSLINQCLVTFLTKCDQDKKFLFA